MTKKEEEAKKQKNKKFYEYQASYVKENCLRVNLKINRKTEKEIAEKLEQQENKTKYIKDLIKKDIERK